MQRVDCDEHPELVGRFAIKHVPTLIVIENRKVSGRLEGSCGCRQIEKLLEPWLAHEAARGSGAATSLISALVGVFVAW